jgi:hypothetical protein
MEVKYRTKKMKFSDYKPSVGNDVTGCLRIIDDSLEKMRLDELDSKGYHPYYKRTIEANTKKIRSLIGS